MEGFPTNFSEEKKIYLCLQYLECEREPVPTLTNSSSCQESCEYNRIQESFKVVIKDKVPDLDFDVCSIQNEKKTIYQNAETQITIERVVPRWVKTGEVFEIKVVVTAPQNGNSIVITERMPPEVTVVRGLEPFIMPNVTGGNVVSIEQTYFVRVANSSEDISIQAQQVQVGNETVDLTPNEDSTVHITKDSVSRKIVDEFFAEKLKQCPDCSENDCVVLASVTLNADGLISAVDDTTPRQYVYSNPLLFDLISCGENKVRQISEKPLKVSSGIYTFSPVTPDQQLISSPIPHGLDEKNISIMLGLEYAQPGSDSFMTMGDLTSLVPNFFPSLVSLHHPNNQDFFIVLKDRRKMPFLEVFREFTWKVRWWAVPNTVIFLSLPPPMLRKGMYPKSFLLEY